MDYLSLHLQEKQSSVQEEEDQGAEDLVCMMVHEACPRALSIEEVRVATLSKAKEAFL